MKLILKGSKNEIKWFHKILNTHPKVDVQSKGKLYPARGANQQVLNGVYRQDVGIKKANVNREKESEV